MDNEWKYINWGELYEVFQIQTSREEVKCIVKAVLNRIQSINNELDYNSVKDNSFNNYLMWDLWKSPAKALEEIISNSDLYPEETSDFNKGEIKQFLTIKQ